MNGEGYIRKRGKSSWHLTVYLGKDENGKPRQLSKTVRGTEKDAKAELVRLLAERNQGVELKPEQITFEELAQRWRDAHFPGLSAQTTSTYELLLRLHILPVIGKTRLRDFKPLHIEVIKSGVIKKGRSAKLALNVHRVVAMILRQAVRWQLLSGSPADMVEPPRAKKFLPHTPTPEELGRLLAALDQTPYGPVARLASLTGARQGELLALAWRDVDWQGQTLLIKGTKTVGSVRIVDLAGLAMDLLREHRQAEREKRLMLGPAANCGSDDAPIFTNLVGKPMDAGGLKRSWRRVVAKAGVGPVRFHDLRHASATYQLRAGVPVQMVSQRLGHTRTSTTTDIYAHVLPGMGRHAAEVLESVMVKSWSIAKEG